MAPLVDYYKNPTTDNLKKLARVKSATKNPAEFMLVVRHVGGDNLAAKVNLA